MLLRSPGFAGVAVLSLALGIGANTTIFSIVNALLVRPLPYQSPEQLVAINETQLRQGISKAKSSVPNFTDWKAQNHVFQQMAAYDDQVFTLHHGSEPEPIEGAIISAELFPMLGVNPIRGRAFVEEDYASGAHAAIISERLWQRLFNADANLNGKTLKLNDESYSVVGVMPTGFGFPEVAELWTPLPLDAGSESRTNHSLDVLARLKPGVTLEQARIDIATIALRLESQYQATNKNWSTRITPYSESVIDQDIRPVLYILLATVGFVLLIACVNVANLLLARAVARQKEIAIRTALGAGRARLIRQLLTESILIAMLGGALGILFAHWGLNLLTAALPDKLPFWIILDIDGRVLGFTILISALTGIIFGLVPALLVSKPDLNAMLKDGGRGASGGPRRGRLQSALVVSEVALSLVLLIGAALLIKSFVKMQESSPGFEPNNVLTMQLALNQSQYPSEPQRADFYTQVMQKISTSPGVHSAGAISILPLSGSDANVSIVIEGQRDQSRGAYPAGYSVITPNYLSAMGIHLLKGRAFNDDDNKNSLPAAIINESMGRRFWPNEDPVGKRFRQWSKTQDNPWLSVVGVATDVKRIQLSDKPEAQVYIPHAQNSLAAMSLVVRTISDPRNSVASFRREIQTVDKKQSVYNVLTMEEVLTLSVWLPRIYSLLFTVFAGVALLMATIGLYGVISYFISQRNHEIGIRMALGAQPKDVLRLVLRQGMLLASVGIGIGLVAAFGVTRVLSSLLYGVSSTDAFTFGLISALLAFVALMASYIPARRAMRVDPMIVLRSE
jgi:putative ABC transport system permease protein